MDWIDLALDSEQCRALVNTEMKLWIPYNIWIILSSLAISNFSRRDWIDGV
jgi:hypothetical protein